MSTAIEFDLQARGVRSVFAGECGVRPSPEEMAGKIEGWIVEGIVPLLRMAIDLDARYRSGDLHDLPPYGDLVESCKVLLTGARMAVEAVARTRELTGQEVAGAAELSELIPMLDELIREDEFAFNMASRDGQLED